MSDPMKSRDEWVALNSVDAETAVAKAFEAGNPFDRMFEDPSFFGVDIRSGAGRLGIVLDGVFTECTGDDAVAAVTQAFKRLGIGKP